ncbi:hypothetical protein [Sphingomonas aracearum]|uniref:Uncharacterized protein n=1 Tax=Sphingomonas aracearum TaxID=2283317 RepID=A0A369VY15_9SPHN|nr:hypothetical protein [Sphingomonas aracearum]RDE07198.1 hypothetical protein DVW87_06045 [Sphingomonas aracearum]
MRIGGLLLGAAVLLGGCGAARDLKPAPGEQLPVAPRGATATPTAGQLTQPTTQQRPERSDDLIYRSEQRRTDGFDLPPSE